MQHAGSRAILPDVVETTRRIPEIGQQRSAVRGGFDVVPVPSIPKMPNAREETVPRPGARSNATPHQTCIAALRLGVQLKPSSGAKAALYRQYCNYGRRQEQMGL